MTRASLRYTTFLLLSDCFIVLLALRTSETLRLLLPWGQPTSPDTWRLPPYVYLIAALTWVSIFLILDVYNSKYLQRVIRELMRVATAAVIAWLLLAGLLYFASGSVSRLQFFAVLLISLALIVLHRLAVRTFFRLNRGSKRFKRRRLAIVGDGQIAATLAAIIERQYWTGLELVGFIQTDDTSPHDCDCPAPLLGSITDVAHLVETWAIDEVIFALPRSDMQTVSALIAKVQRMNVNVRLVPDFFDLAFFRLKVEDFYGLPLLTLKEPVLDPVQRIVKRAIDLAATAIMLVPALPVMAVCAAAIWLDSGAPILFKQKRIGEHGKPFYIYKFRSMVVNAEQLQHTVNRYDEHGNLIHKSADDPRITRVGRFLRANSLDELPQLFNVIRGDMSLVGPRPELPWLVENYQDWQYKRLEVPQGITGWWQVNGRSDRPMHLNTEDDLHYITDYSVWNDLKILWMTVRVVMSRRGAH